MGLPFLSLCFLGAAVKLFAAVENRVKGHSCTL
eukprot:COSAG02_NODE_41077_length_398_cov_1.036789_1_plen_32_part_01